MAWRSPGTRLEPPGETGDAAVRSADATQADATHADTTHMNGAPTSAATTFLRNFRPLFARFGQSNGNRLFATSDFAPGATALERAVLHFVHGTLDFAAARFAVFSGHLSLLRV